MTIRIEAKVSNLLADFLADRLNDRRSDLGLRWSDDMPDDGDPDHPWWVTDPATGESYEIEVCVSLYRRTVLKVSRDGAR